MEIKVDGSTIHFDKNCKSFATLFILCVPVIKVAVAEGHHSLVHDFAKVNTVCMMSSGAVATGQSTS